jgi:predicted Mrr-cat superfamily restriction endonuclease
LYVSFIFNEINVRYTEEVEAIMDFFPVSDEEIGFYKGDVIVNVSKVDDEWLRGHVNGKFGYFPCDYVKVGIM